MEDAFHAEVAPGENLADDDAASLVWKAPSNLERIKCAFDRRRRGRPNLKGSPNLDGTLIRSADLESTGCASGR